MAGVRAVAAAAGMEVASGLATASATAGAGAAAAGRQAAPTAAAVRGGQPLAPPGGEQPGEQQAVLFWDFVWQILT